MAHDLHEKLEVGMLVGISPSGYSGGAYKWKIATVTRVTKTTVVADGKTFVRNAWLPERGKSYKNALRLVSHEVAAQHNDELEAEQKEEMARHTATLNLFFENLEKMPLHSVRSVAREAESQMKEQKILTQTVDNLT